MKVAILNESFFTERHLEMLRSFGQLKIFEDTDTEEKAIQRMQGFDVVIADCYIAPLNKKVLESADKVKLLAINSTGYDLVDIVAAKRQGIRVANVPGFSTEAVAEHAIALMLSVSKNIPAGDRAMRKRPFQIDPASIDEKKYCGFNLSGKTLGIIGLGNIGQRTAQIGRSFGMKVLAFNRSKKNLEGVTQVTLEKLLKESDIVSLHLPSTPETENILNADRLQMMKHTAVLINTARGNLIDEKALYNALRTHNIGGAGLDIIVDWKESNPLTKMDNVVLTPHSAFYTKESLNNCAGIIVQNVSDFAEGKTTNIVNL